MDTPADAHHNSPNALPEAADTPQERHPSGEPPCLPEEGGTDAAVGQAAATPVEEEIGRLILELGLHLKMRAGAVLAQVDLTMPQALVLLSLGRPLSMGEVAGRLRTDPSTVTWLVDRLEARGLVERCSRASDRRVKLLVLTPQGERVREYLHRVFADVPGLAALSSAQLETLRDLLRRAVGACS